MSSRRRKILFAGIATGLATWWAFALIMLTLSDLALLAFGTNSEYDANPEQAAYIWGPLIGLLVGSAVVALGFALSSDGER